MVTTFREEFRLKQLSPSHTREELFYLPQWRIPPVFFVLYRIAIAGFVDFNILLDCTNYGKSNPIYPWPVYLTHWSYFMLAAHLTVAAIIAVLHNVEDSGPGCCRPHRKHTEDLLNEDDIVEHELGYHGYSVPWYMKFDWVLFGIIVNFAVIVTIVYFAFLYPMHLESGVPIGYENFNMHALNTVIVVIEVFVSAIPVRILHVVYPVTYGLLYMVFSLIYWSYDHTHVIYEEILDWNKPGQTVAFVLITGLIACPLIQLILYGLYRLRLKLFAKCH